MSAFHLVFNLILLTCLLQNSSGTLCQDQGDCSNNSKCVDNTCRGPLGSACTWKYDCDSGHECQDGQCALAAQFKTSCTLTLDCPVDQRCIFSSCQEPRIGGQCESSIDCPGSSMCKNSVCDNPYSFTVPPILLVVAFVVFIIIGMQICRKVCFNNRHRPVTALVHTPVAATTTTTTVFTPPPPPPPPPPPMPVVNVFQQHHHMSPQPQWATFGPNQQMPPVNYTSNQAMPVASGPIGGQQFDQYHAPPAYDSATTATNNEPSAPPPYNPHFKG